MTSVSCASLIERLTKIDSSNAMSSSTPGGSDGLDARQASPDGVGHLDQVGLRLPDHADGRPRRALEAERAPLVLGAQLDAAQVLQLDQLSALARHDQVAELLPAS